MLVSQRIAVQCHKCGRSYEINKKYAASPHLIIGMLIIKVITYIREHYMGMLLG